MNSETEIFLHDLFARCSAQPRAFLTLTAIHPDGDRPTPSRHVLLGNAPDLDYALKQLHKANERGWGAYLGIAPRNRNLGRWSRGGKCDLVCLPALFADIDQPDLALARLGLFDLPASCILQSGHGYHAYWLLETPTVDFAKADRALRGLAEFLHGDTVLSVAHSMRLVGTCNTKTDRNGALCQFITYHPERRYDLNEFTPFLPKIVYYVPRAQAWTVGEGDRSHHLSSSLLEAMADAVLDQLEGHWRTNGYIAARCPLPHQKDRPGMHFSYHAETGWGHCFGKHGSLSPTEMCHLLGVTCPHLSGVVA